MEVRKKLSPFKEDCQLPTWKGSAREQLGFWEHAGNLRVHNLFIVFN